MAHAMRQPDPWGKLDWLIIDEPDSFKFVLPRTPQTIRQDFRLIDGSLDRRTESSSVPTEAMQFAYMVTTRSRITSSADATETVTWRVALATLGGLIIVLAGVLGVTLVALGLRSAPYIAMCYLIPIGLWAMYVGLKAVTPKLESV